MILRGGDGGSDDSDTLRSTRDGEGGDESQSQAVGGEDGGEEGGVELCTRDIKGGERREINYI